MGASKPGESLIILGLKMGGRSEPMERIIELSDASVPFAFDLHVMLYSDNAPELEGALHQLVDDRRVNLVNARKEFYANVELEEIEKFVKERGLSAQFIKIPEAKEYRETVARREQQRLTHEQALPAEKFSRELFATKPASN